MLEDASAACVLLPEIPLSRFPLHKSNMHFKLEKELTLVEHLQHVRPHVYMYLSISYIIKP